ncbi:MAG: DMT family transporter [Phyllobacteriaceae bacterium]|nr:DMT family transporter [Phyllobacteriaceae bacterium]
MRRNLGFVLALILIGAAWALTFPLTKMAVLGGYRSFGIIFWSSVIGAIVLAAISWMRGLGLPTHRAALGRYLFVALLGTVLPSAATYTAAEHLPAGVIAVCMAVIPIVTFPMALAFGMEQPNWKSFLGLLLGLLGVLLIVVPDASLPDPSKAVFVLLSLLSVLSYAAEGVGLSKIGRAGLDPAQLMLGAFLLSAGLTLPMALISGTFIVPTIGFGTAGLAVVLSALANVVAYVGYVWIIGRAGAVFAGQVSYLVTAFSIFWSMALLGESYSTWVWAAVMVIFAGLFLTQPRHGGDADAAKATSTSAVPR